MALTARVSFMGCVTGCGFTRSLQTLREPFRIGLSKSNRPIAVTPFKQNLNKFFIFRANNAAFVSFP
ncbi:hypothetical protein [Paraburkholderia sp. ZP32-5]|uniref:hypothetical protein n=1 Tax=Paraburkholderia sp. ZP32-5 TaxID=2883245 RepID=UPI001F1FAA86|nr:hypothetical protein [Paraburkholderia sp. ZP32-5]